MTPIRNKNRNEKTSEGNGGQQLVRRRRSTGSASMDPISRFFTNLFPNFGAGEWMGSARHPRIDIRERDNEYEVRCELPGIPRDNVEVGVTDDRLEIRGAAAEEPEEDEGDYYYRETGQQSYFRSVPLPPDANPDEVEAKMEDGILRVTIGKREDGGSRRRTVRVG